MSKKLIALLALSMALICTVSVCGTMAYLTGSANGGEGVTNTFTAKGGGKMLESPDGFQIIETNVTTDSDGNIVNVTGATNTNTSGNSYEVIPDTKVPKKAVVAVDGKTDVEAYLLLEVVSTLDKNVFDFTVGDDWQEVKDASGDSLVGAKGGTVYVYSAKTGTKAPIIVKSDVPGVGILKNDEVIVKDATESTMESLSEGTLEFYAYLAQSTIGTPAEAYTTSFLTTT